MPIWGGDKGFLNDMADVGAAEVVAEFVPGEAGTDGFEAVEFEFAAERCVFEGAAGLLDEFVGSFGVEDVVVMDEMPLRMSPADTMAGCSALAPEASQIRKPSA